MLTEFSPFWRISLASITQDGPYSVFKGAMRHQTIVAGKGLSLLGEGQEIELPFGSGQRFSGSDHKTAQLLDGSVKALNVIWQPEHVDVQVSEVSRAKPKLGTVNVWFAMQGGYTICGTVVDQGDAALCESAEVPTFNEKARVILVAVTPIG